MHRGVDPFDKRSMALSAGVHVAIFALAWASALYEPTQIEFMTYEIELVSPPPARQAEEPEPATEELVVERPDPEPTPPEPEVEEIIPVEDPEPDPDPPPEERDEPAEEDPPEAAETTVVAAAEDPLEEEPEESGEGLEVRMEGLRRDYPEYYNNIILQIRRCFRWRDGGNWETVVLFDIDRDGRAHEMRFAIRSGSTAFDFEALGAVGCAGKGAFGPLPEDIPYERFPVRFRFQPNRDLFDFVPQAGIPTEVTYDR
jgi:outer membrane biosynthesis protein TonB